MSGPDPAALPDGWERKDVEHGHLTGGIVGPRTWYRAIDEDLEGVEIEVTAFGVMLHGVDAWIEWQQRGLADLRVVLELAAARMLELRERAAQEATS